uniref:Uncharacterized protein n=1 Tax=Pyxicephalus adspersus TaxID=30357 RepID=A0AAV3AEP4_PYXAD|nr:TPA: hypothetical protein GDO54_018307 [Pyxicephalus adspersus]
MMGQQNDTNVFFYNSLLGKGGISHLKTRNPTVCLSRQPRSWQWLGKPCMILKNCLYSIYHGFPGLCRGQGVDHLHLSDPRTKNPEAIHIFLTE